MITDSLSKTIQKIENEVNNYQLLAEQAKSKEEISNLILNHSKPASEVAELLGMNHVAFKDFVNELLESGELPEVLKISNQYKYTLYHIHTLMEKRGTPAWRDKFSDCVVTVISNLKGGTGKTTTSVSVATAVSLELVNRKRVLLIDLDPQGSQAKHANIDVENDATILTAVDIMLGDEEPDSIYSKLKENGLSHEEIVLNSLVETHIPNLSIFPAFPEDERFNSAAWLKVLEKAQKGGDTGMDSLNLLKNKIIDVVKDHFDFVFIDTAPTMNPLVWSAFEAATGMLIPCMAHALDWESTQKFIKALPSTFESLPSKGKNIGWWKVLATNYEEEYNRDKHILDKMKETLGSDLLNNVIPRSTAFEKAVQQECTVFDFKKSDKVVPNKQLDKAQLQLNACARELMLYISDVSS